MEVIDDGGYLGVCMEIKKKCRFFALANLLTCILQVYTYTRSKACVRKVRHTLDVRWCGVVGVLHMRNAMQL